MRSTQGRNGVEPVRVLVGTSTAIQKIQRAQWSETCVQSSTDTRTVLSNFERNLHSVAVQRLGLTAGATS